MDIAERQLLIARKLSSYAAGRPYHKILLINPPQIPGTAVDSILARNRRYFAQPPYGLGLLAAHLSDQGYALELLDLNFELLSALNSLSAKSADNRSAKSIWNETLQDKIAVYQPDVIGVSCMFTTVYENAREIVNACKNLTPETPIFFGGVAIINDPKGILKNTPAIDFLCLYEDDESFCNALDFLNAKGNSQQLTQIATVIDGVYVALDERVAPKRPAIDRAPSFGSLPLELYSSVGEIGAYRFWLPKETKASTVITNRGCRAHCAFCSVRGFCGPGVRARSTEAVIKEIQELQDSYGITHIMWLDDDLLYDAPRALRLFNEMVRKDIRITWDATNGLIAAAITDEIMQAASESGCIGLNLGIESGSERILREMKKPASLQHYRNAATVLKKFPQIFTRGFLIIGFPDETLSDVQQTINFARDLDLDWYTIQILCPLPATTLYRQMFPGTNTDDELDLGKLNFGSSHTGRQRNIEQQERLFAQDFFDLFDGDISRAVEPLMLNDIWFLADYRINYERIYNNYDLQQLAKWRKLLQDVADRITTENPLANYYLAVIEERLGKTSEASFRQQQAQAFTDSSAYWHKRFSVLGLTVADYKSAS
jgi:radical SAM superfamily enzyme YgiQ (UPF0313 family)